MPKNSPVHSLAFFPNGDIQLILAHKDQPYLRIPRGSPESVPFTALMHEVITHNAFKAKRPRESAEPVSKPTEPAASSEKAPNVTTIDRSVFVGAHNDGRPEPIRNPPEMTEGLRDRAQEVHRNSTTSNARSGERRVRTGSAQPSPDDEYFNDVGFDPASVDIPPEWMEEEMSNPAPISSERIQPEHENASGPKFDYEMMASNPSYWITGIVLSKEKVTETREPGLIGRVLNRKPTEKLVAPPTPAVVNLGDKSKMVIEGKGSAMEILGDVISAAEDHLKTYRRSKRKAQEKANQPIERKHELVRWADGENGARRFAVNQDGRQVPIDVDEKFAEGLIRLMEEGSLEHVTAMHNPKSGAVEISHVKTNYYDDLIPANEASAMAESKFFPTTYPPMPVEKEHAEDLMKEILQTKEAYASQQTEITGTISQPNLELKKNDIEDKSASAEKGEPIPEGLKHDFEPSEASLGLITGVGGKEQRSGPSHSGSEAEEPKAPTAEAAPAENVPDEPKTGQAEVEQPVEATKEKVGDEAPPLDILEKSADEIANEAPPENADFQMPNFPTIDVGEVDNGYARMSAQPPEKPENPRPPSSPDID